MIHSTFLQNCDGHNPAQFTTASTPHSDCRILLNRAKCGSTPEKLRITTSSAYETVGE
jgi:hypothetical protein